MHHGVGSIRPPRFGAQLGVARRAAERLAHAEVRRRKRIRQVQRPHREIVCGPRPDPGERGRSGNERIEIVRAVEDERATRDRTGEPVDRRCARRRQADARDRVDARTRDLGGGRKAMRQAGVIGVRRTERADEPPGERRRRGDRHLLAEQRPHRGLEAIDRSGHAQPRSRADPRSDHGIAGEQARDHVGPRIEIEQPAHARDERHQRRDERRRRLSSNAGRSFACVTSITPVAPPMWTTRRYTPPCTVSTPGIARAARKPRIWLHSYGGR